MGKEIRTRQIHKDIKMLDRAVTGTERMKRVYVRTKDSAEQTRDTEHTTPVDYAESKISNSADTMAHETAHQTWKQGKKAFNGIKDTIHQPKEHSRKSGQELAKKKAVQAKSLRQQSIRTLERGEKTIKTAEYGGQAVKNTGKGTVKYARRTVKTAEQTARTTVKTTQNAARTARIAAKTSVKTAEKAVVAARQAARTAAQTARVAARATVAAVRAVIAATKALISAILAGGWIAVLILVIVILFGGVLCIVGGGNSNTVTPLSAEVEAYEPLIRKYAKQYGIGEYVELLKAVMMQESGGRGLDPMQSSEGAFNTKYPRQPNGITDPEYSIACGVQELKACLESAEVKNPVDMDNIKLALQSYNFGNGYISWAREHYGGYTMSNAAEFSDMMAERMGWESYGDKQYVPHVLQYYVFGRIPTGTGNQAIVQVALTQEGNAGGQPYWSWYGFGARVEWCACFVSWCANQCGYIESGVVPKFAKCTVGAEWFQSNGQWQDASYTPKAGDLIFFMWAGDTETSHVGIVERVENGVIYTVEGNSGDEVARNSYRVGSSVIYGYGIPAY